VGRHANFAWSLTPLRFAGAFLSLTPAIVAGAEPFPPESSFRAAQQAIDPVEWVMLQADPAPGATVPGAPTAPQPVKNDWMALLFIDTPSGRRVQMAPLRWRGNLGFELRWTRSDAGRQDQAIEFANVAAAPYLGQPWLAQVRGNIGILGSQQKGNAESTLNSIGGLLPGDKSVNLMGGGMLSVFPSSRFPFIATFDVSDSRAAGEAVASDYTNRQAALRQSYRTPLGDQVYAGSLEYSSMLSQSFGRDTVGSLNGSMQRTWLTQLLDVNGAFTVNRRSATDDGADTARLSARHSWRPNDNASLDSFASFSDSRLMGTTDSFTRFGQMNSFGTWRPDDESPLLVTGGLRASDATFGVGTGTATSRTVGANTAVSYSFNPATQVVGSVNLTDLQADNVNAFVTTESLAGHYTPAPIQFGRYTYSWATSVTGSFQTGGIDGNQHAAVEQANHQLSRGWDLGASVSLQVALNQGIAFQQESVRAPTRTLQNSASIGLRVAPTTGSDAFLSVSGGDSRSQGGREDRFQLLNVQATGQLQLGIFSLLSANLTIQAIRQRLEGEETDRSTVQRSGTLSYQHLRVFGVPRLRFMFTSMFNDVQLESRLFGDVNAPHDQYTRLYEGKLLYDIGRLELRLGTRLATLDGKTDRQIFFRVNRQFGLF